MSHREQIIIGIDPDTDRNGIAMLDMSIAQAPSPDARLPQPP